MKSFSINYDILTFIKMMPVALIFIILRIFIKNNVAINIFLKLVILAVAGFIMFISWAYIINVREIKDFIKQLFQRK